MLFKCYLFHRFVIKPLVLLFISAILSFWISKLQIISAVLQVLQAADGCLRKVQHPKIAGGEGLVHSQYNTISCKHSIR